MGVLGLTPFIQKHCPQVIRELPHRLKTLSGKTIAIDGTLITQRLHFAPMPCDNRHILGWYRLIRELKESGVGVICVFDGAERGLAKQREGERRRKVQRMEVARGVMESDRLRRLRRLTELLNTYQALPEHQRGRSTKILQKIIREPFENVPSYETSHGMARQLESDIFQLANEPAVPVSTPAADQKETFPVVNPPTTTVLKALHKEASVSHATPSEPALVKQLLESQTQFMESSQSSHSVNDNLSGPEDVSRSHHSSENGATPHEMIPLASISPQSPSFSCKLSHVTMGFDEGVPGNRSSASPVKSSNKHSPIVIGPEDVRQGPRDPVDSTHKTVVTSNILEVDEYIDDDPDEPLTELSEYSRLPTSVRLDSYGPINTVHSHVMEPPDDLYVEFEERSALIDFESSEPGRDTPETVVDDPTGPADDVARGLLSLYHDYHQSVPAMMSPQLLDPPTPGSSEEADAGTQEQYAMSKTQVQLTLDEGNLWRSFIDPSATAATDPGTTLMSLSRKSESLSKSYEIRNNPPTSKTYEESKLILQAMGVPCIEPIVPYEAEALAASLVHHGFADYVASEDTDVLVYEAPLLRNISNRQSPLTLLSGSEIRQALQLDRASYVDFALLLGTDFSQRIKNLGPHRAIKLIRAHGRIEHVIANEPKFIPRLPADAYLEQVEIARLVFETLPPLPSPKLLQPMDSDEGLIAALLDKYGVYREAMVDWDFASALDGNYFNDNPSMN